MLSSKTYLHCSIDFYCVCVKQITLYNYLCSSSHFSAKHIQDFGTVNRHSGFENFSIWDTEIVSLAIYEAIM